MGKGVLFLVVLQTLWSAASPSMARAQVETPAAGAPASPAASPPVADPAVEPAPETPEQAQAEAKAAESRAAHFFHDNQFIEAAQLLELAYRKHPRPILLFNAGQAYRKAEHAVEAKTMYEQFLTVAPTHPLSAEARGYLKDMEALIAMQDRGKQVALALEERLAATQTSQQQAAEKLEQERLRSLQIRNALLQAQTQLERQKQSRRRLILGLEIGLPLLGAATIAAVAVTTIFLSRASTSGGTVVIAQ